MANFKAYGYLKPGQNGTKRLVEQFGKALYCVRYRIDEERGKGQQSGARVRKSTP